MQGSEGSGALWSRRGEVSASQQLIEQSTEGCRAKDLELAHSKSKRQRAARKRRLAGRPAH